MNRTFAIITGVVVAMSGAARAEDSPTTNLLPIESVEATSTKTTKVADEYAPWRAILPTDEGDPSTGSVITSAWCDGIDDRGVNEKLSIKLAAPTVIDKITILPGLWKDDAAWEQNDKPVSFKIVTSDGRMKVVKASADEKAEVEYELGGKPVKQIVIELWGVQPGPVKGQNDSCISAVYLSRDGEQLRPVLGLDQAAVDALLPAARAISAALETCDAAKLADLVEFPFSYASNSWFFEGKKAPKPKTFKDAKALKKKKCPVERLDAEEERPYFSSPGPGWIDLPVTHNELPQMWRLHWAGGKWKLARVDY